MAEKKSNIKDLSEITGMSVSTISRVLNGKAKQFRISKKTQEKVLNAAKELNYVPNQIAVNLKRGKTKTIALVIPSLSNPFFANMAAMVSLELRKQGYTTLISDSNEQTDLEQEELMQVVSRNVDGILLSPCSEYGEHINSVQKQGIPLVCFDRYFPNKDVPYVSSDNFRGAYEGTKYLIENGHKKIACIQGLLSSVPNQVRREGFEAMMKEAQLTDYNITGNEFSVQNGYTETLLLLQATEKPSAIFTFSNNIALGCMKALKEFNLKLPEDISLLTFDNHPYLDYLSTPLTCIAQPVEDICRIAIKQLFSLIDKQELNPDKVLLKPQIIFRDSVKRLA